MASHRHSRAGEDIKRELSALLRELKDPRVTAGMISIVATDLSGDGSHCKVYISSMEGLEAAKSAVEGLNNAAGFIRKEIGSRIMMRHTPSFKFYADDSIAHSAEIIKMLNDLED